MCGKVSVITEKYFSFPDFHLLTSLASDPMVIFKVNGSVKFGLLTSQISTGKEIKRQFCQCLL